MMRRCGRLPRETPMKRILRWLVDGYHWLHIAWGMLIPLAGAYIFFTAPDMNWRIDAITAIVFFPFAVFAVLLFRNMFRKRSITPKSQTIIPTSPLVDPIQQSRKNAR
jgi:hypothetical protein